jgi:hypothetical protein
MAVLVSVNAELQGTGQRLAIRATGVDTRTFLAAKPTATGVPPRDDPSQAIVVMVTRSSSS